VFAPREYRFGAISTSDNIDIRAGTVLAGPGGAAVTIESLLGRGGFGQVFARVTSFVTVRMVGSLLRIPISPVPVIIATRSAKRIAQ
jgi:hypothetical protein